MIFRKDLERPLTWEEMDGNFKKAEEKRLIMNRAPTSTDTGYSKGTWWQHEDKIWEYKSNGIWEEVKLGASTALLPETAVRQITFNPDRFPMKLFDLDDTQLLAYSDDGILLKINKDTYVIQEEIDLENAFDTIVLDDITYYSVLYIKELDTLYIVDGENSHNSAIHIIENVSDFNNLSLTTLELNQDDHFGDEAHILETVYNPITAKFYISFNYNDHTLTAYATVDVASKTLTWVDVPAGLNEIKAPTVIVDDNNFSHYFGININSLK